MDDLPYESFIERRLRCKAIRLTPFNVWQAAQALARRGWEVNVRVRDGIFLEAQRNDESFVADIEAEDALLINGYDDFEYIPGLEFRKQWEKETG